VTIDDRTTDGTGVVRGPVAGLETKLRDVADDGTGVVLATGFGADLMRRVEAQLSDDDLHRAHRRIQRKAVVIVAWYVLSYVGIVLATGWISGLLTCTSLALSMVAVGFNIQHDANHNALFDTSGSRRLSTANRIAGMTLHAIGGNSKRWIDGHVLQHHASPNVVGKDYDIEIKPFARMAPSQRHRPWHQRQHLYIWVVYGFTAISIIVADITNTVMETFSGDRHGKKPTALDYTTMVVSKGIFGLAMLGVPLLFHPWWIVTLGAVYVLGLAGFLLGIVFQLAHVSERAAFCDADNRPDMRWHEWQVRSSVDFCQGTTPSARFITWFVGGLNYQTEHHLFPRLPHTVYPAIAPTVEATCVEHEIPYHTEPTLRSAVRAHYRHMRELGRPPADAPVTS